MVQWTSGRIAVQDGVELTPTFGWPKTKIDFMLAGGKKALMDSIEDAEDDTNSPKIIIEKKILIQQMLCLGLQQVEILNSQMKF